MNKYVVEVKCFVEVCADDVREAENSAIEIVSSQCDDIAFYAQAIGRLYVGGKNDDVQ